MEEEAALQVEERLRRYIDTSGDCHLWTRSTNRKGYGGISVQGRRYQPHRLIWILANKQSIPEGMCVCHTCDNPSCCNPEHLFLGTYADNIRDCMQKGRWRSYGAGLERSHCRNGHPFDDSNTYRWADGRRACRVCSAAAARRYRKKLRV